MTEIKGCFQLFVQTHKVECSMTVLLSAIEDLVQIALEGINVYYSVVLSDVISDCPSLSPLLLLSSHRGDIGCGKSRQEIYSSAVEDLPSLLKAFLGFSPQHWREEGLRKEGDGELTTLKNIYPSQAVLRTFKLKCKWWVFVKHMLGNEQLTQNM